MTVRARNIVGSIGVLLGMVAMVSCEDSASQSSNELQVLEQSDSVLVATLGQDTVRLRWITIVDEDADTFSESRVLSILVSSSLLGDSLYFELRNDVGEVRVAGGGRLVGELAHTIRLVVPGQGLWDMALRLRPNAADSIVFDGELAQMLADQAMEPELLLSSSSGPTSSSSMSSSTRVYDIDSALWRSEFVTPGDTVVIWTLQLVSDGNFHLQAQFQNASNCLLRQREEGSWGIVGDTLRMSTTTLLSAPNCLSLWNPATYPNLRRDLLLNLIPTADGRWRGLMLLPEANDWVYFDTTSIAP